MKRLLLIITLTSMVTVGMSQSFQKIIDLILPDSIKSAQSAWVDLDNDGLLDIVLLTISQSNKNFIMVVKGDTINTPVLLTASTLTLNPSTFSLWDYNRDNKIDVLLSGEKNGIPATAVYINKGDYKFEEGMLDIPAFSRMKVADLNDDARLEWILSGEDNGAFFTKIYEQKTDNSWTLVHDSLYIKASALEVFDADFDGDNDLFISGAIDPDSLFTGFLINQGGLYFKPSLTSEQSGTASVGDLNQDGTFDVLWMGHDTNGAFHSTYYQSKEKTHEAINSSITLSNANIFISDLNSDGSADVNYFGEASNGDTLNIIQYGVENYDTLVHKKVTDQDFGDFDHDGDLDFLQFVQLNALQLNIYENQHEQQNNFPGMPFNAVALPVFNRLFMYWERPSDDYTPEQSLTFDMFLQGTSDLLVGEFDLLNGMRLLPANGNSGTHNFRLLKNVPLVNINYAIQSIDNALHAGDGDGICMGSVSPPCASIEPEELTVCTNEKINLTSPPQSLWFSFSSGYLGTFDSYSFQPDLRDTIFYFNPAQPGCAALKVWTIAIDDEVVKTENDEKYACENSSIHLEADAGWLVVNWESILRGNLGNASFIDYTVTQPDSVFLTVVNPEGCKIISKTAIKISKPLIEVGDDHYKIMKGGSVQLLASGADHYVWSPPTGLNQHDIPNPVATPTSSIQYTVTGYDSLNCQDQAHVTIIVEGAGFIPNLFTPNNDGKNDELKIYGLSPLNSFTLSIYNREGSLVYKTSSTSEATQQGWDGRANGTQQPSGVYFWKVKGAMNSGDKVLLNGKESGSIVLIR